MNIQDIARMRVVNQHLTSPHLKTAADVATWMGALQGQDYASSLHAVALRTPNLTTADVAMAFADREIVRTWPMRGTLHIVPSQDAAWMMRLLGARGIAASKTRRAQLGLDARTTLDAFGVFERVLEDQPRTRPELYDALRHAGINPDGQRGIHLIGHAAQTGLICGIGKPGAQPAFALLEQWCPNPVQIDGDEAWATLAGRYIQSHGPVTERDFAWWAGITLAQAKNAFSIDASKLESVNVESDTFVTAPCDIVGTVQQRVVLVPGFDESYLGYRNRSAMLAVELQPLVVPGGNGVFRPVVLFDGVAVGTWVRPRKSTMEPDISWFSDNERPPASDLLNAYARLAAVTR